MEYTVVEAASAEALRREVQERLDQGWEPQGGMAVATHSGGSWWYYQALVRSHRKFTTEEL